MFNDSMIRVFWFIDQSLATEYQTFIIIIIVVVIIITARILLYTLLYRQDSPYHDLK